MRIATYNVNGVNGRLVVLLRWLRQAQPDVVCLQELKAPEERFPAKDIEKAGYHAIWHGQKSWNGVAILAKEQRPLETRRGLPGDPEDLHSRYIEAEVSGLTIGCLYLPNGNPWPGPKFDYKLQWFERLTKHAAKLIKSAKPVILAGDYNVMPTEIDVYKPERWVNDALFPHRGAQGLRQARQARLDRRPPSSSSGRAHLHVLGLFPERLRPQCGAPHRPLSAEPRNRAQAQSRRRR
jgi:exodeoxyribonuclease III